MDEWMLVVLLAFCSLLLVFSFLCLPRASLCVPRASPCIEFTPALSRECLEQFQKKKFRCGRFFFDCFFGIFLAKSLWTPYTLYFFWFFFWRTQYISLDQLEPGAANTVDEKKSLHIHTAKIVSCVYAEAL